MPRKFNLKHERAMTPMEILMQKILETLKASGRPDLRQDLLEAIRGALLAENERIHQENEFHKRLSQDMLQGLQGIYREIAQLTRTGGEEEKPASAEEATALFKEASRQLDEIMTTTLTATEAILEKVEGIQARQNEVRGLLKALDQNTPEVRRMTDLLSQNMEFINAIVTSLSFQDLTGQRIKKVIKALSSIHGMVVELYLSAGLMLKKSTEQPDQDLEKIAQESRQQAAELKKSSDLKGPALNSSQKDVDDLLAQLGM